MTGSTTSSGFANIALIGLKTLFGFQRGNASAHEMPAHLELTSGGTRTTLDINEDRSRHSSPE